MNTKKKRTKSSWIDLIQLLNLTIAVARSFQFQEEEE